MRQYYPEYWSFLTILIAFVAITPALPVGPYANFFVADWPFSAVIVAGLVAISVAFHFAFDAYAYSESGRRGVAAPLIPLMLRRTIPTLLKQFAAVVVVVVALHILGFPAAFSLSAFVVVIAIGYWLSLILGTLARRCAEPAASVWTRAPSLLAAGIVRGLASRRWGWPLLSVGVTILLWSLADRYEVLIAVFVGLLMGAVIGTWAELLDKLRTKEAERAQPRLPVCWVARGTALAGFFLLLIWPAVSGPMCKTLSRHNLDKTQEVIARYYYSNSRLPPSAVVDAQGAPLLSWRVVLLPYLWVDREDCRFDLSEPWSSRKNRAAFNACNSLLLPFYGKSTWGWHSYKIGYVHVLDCTLHAPPGNYGEPDPDMPPDETNTIMILEVVDPNSNWSQPTVASPGDFRRMIEEAGPLGIPSPHPDGSHVLLRDGRVAFLSRAVIRSILREFMNRPSSEEMSHR